MFETHTNAQSATFQAFCSKRFDKWKEQPCAKLALSLLNQQHWVTGQTTVSKKDYLRDITIMEPVPCI